MWGIVKLLLLATAVVIVVAIKCRPRSSFTINYIKSSESFESLNVQRNVEYYRQFFQLDPVNHRVIVLEGSGLDWTLPTENDLYKVVSRTLYQPLSVTVQNVSLTLSRFVVRLSSLADVDLEGVEQVYVIASQYIIADANISLPGIDLSIVAPKWHFVEQEIFVNLRGRDGYTTSTRIGPDGNNGTRGQDGGSFRGVGEWIGQRNFSVDVSGGNGSDGQDGLPGRDGVSGGIPERGLTVSCYAKNGHVTNAKGVVYKVYFVFPPQTCGTRGGHGGNAGHAGVAGNVYIDNFNTGVYDVMQTDGIAGDAGRGGVGGRGATNGSYFILYVTDAGNWQLDDTKIHYLDRPFQDAKSGRNGIS